LSWQTMDPRLRLSTAPGLDGLIAVQPPKDFGLHIVDASTSDSVATMMLTIPQINGRDLNDLDIVERDGVEWTRWGSSLHMPLDAVSTLSDGTSTVTIAADGYAEWRAVATASTPVDIEIVTTGAWRAYDPSFRPLANGSGDAEISLPPGSGLAYIV